MIIGKLAPDFDLIDVNGNRVSLDTFKDKELVIVIFGCNHCPYVKAYEHRIIKLQADYANKGVALAMINANNDKTYPEDSFENMKKNAHEKGFNFPYLRDETAKTARAYEAKYTPEVFLLDRGRIIRYTGRIDDCWQSEKGVKRHDLKEAIEDILGKREVGVKTTPPIGCTIKWPD